MDRKWTSCGAWTRVVAAMAVCSIGIVFAFATGCKREIAGGKADGAAVYREVCARCHGPHGQPNASTIARLGVKDLTSDELQKRLSDDQIRMQIEKGSKNQQMPSFAGALTDAQLAAIVQHVRSLAKKP